MEPTVDGDYIIDNYFGFPEAVSGRELIGRGVSQAKKFGAAIERERVLSIHYDDEKAYTVTTDRREISACSIILATGIERRKPEIKNLSAFEGRGVSYCVSCDGYFFKNKRILVVGEGNYAANQACELTHYSPAVRICTMGKPIEMSRDFTVRLRQAGIALVEKRISMLKGEAGLSHVVYDSGEESEVDGLFVAIGDASSVDFARSLGIITNGNFIQVDDEQKTNAPGIFAAGDCTGGFLQISVAVGEGAAAAKSAIDYVKNICRV
ncbi:MAG: thioredoxin reductase [Spirochaetes bacterium RBG_13_51_14]|nr:MAG: thioredoxin reductase [Spirochaetes bacterium RBG_13_51_14]